MCSNISTHHTHTIDKPDATDDKQVTSDEEHLAVNPQEEGGEEEEEEEAFGAMISQMTAILSRCQADADIGND